MSTHPSESLNGSATHGVSGSSHDHHPPPFSRVVALLRLERASIVTILIYASAVGVISLAAPLGVQAVVSAIAFGALRQPLLVLSLLVFGALALASTLRALQWAVAEQVQERIFLRAALDIALKLAHARPTAFGGAHPREFVNRFFDVLTVQKGAATLLVEGIYVVLQAVVGCLLLAFYHPFLLAFIVTLLGVTLVILLSLGRSGVATAVEESVAKYAVVSWLEEIANNTTTFRSQAGEAFAQRQARTLGEAYLEARRAHFKVVFRQGTLFLAVQTLATAALLGLGGLLVLQGQITLGQLIAAELIVSAVTGTFSKLGKYLESYYDLMAAVDKVGYLTDLALEPSTGTETIPPAKGNGPLLAVQDLVFDPRGRSVLHNVNFTVAEREHVALLGPNGAGKSALLDLLWGMEIPSQGTISLAGIPLPELSLRHVREDVVLVRDSDLLQGTIADNVRAGRTEVTSDDIRKALDAVGLWDEVARLPKGSSTDVAQAALSEGQMRRLTLARAIVRTPRLLLVDGLLDGLDPASRDPVLRIVFGEGAPWASLVTTHDARIAAQAQKVYRIDQGHLETSPSSTPGTSPSEAL